MKEKNKLQKPVLIKEKNGDYQIDNLSLEHINTWIEEKRIPKKLAKLYIDTIKNMNQDMNSKCKTYMDFLKNKPNPSKQELKNLFKSMTAPSVIQFQEDIKNIANFQRYLVENFEKLTNALEVNTGLFNFVNLDETFGISREMTDSVSYLKELINNATIEQYDDGSFFIKGKEKDSYGEHILVKYELITSSENEAKRLFKRYKKRMHEKGLTIWMAHWKIANEQGNIEGQVKMIDVMKECSDEDRTSSFSVKEKKDHWSDTLMVSRTTISKERVITKKGCKKDSTLWIEQPLLEILGGEKEIDDFPTIIARRLLRQHDNVKFFPAIFKNTTLQLHPSDVNLAFYIQNRASQYQEKKLKLDWPLLLELGNLEKTYISNPRVAKKEIRNKMRRFVERGILENWEETAVQIWVTPSPQIIKNKKLIMTKNQELEN